MQNRMQEHMQQQQGYSQQTTSTESRAKPQTVDYIDFEEVK